MQKDARKGFALIILAVILAIGGILLISIMSPGDKNSLDFKNTGKKLQAIQKAVKVFQNLDPYNALPCPAKINQDPVLSTAFGKSNGVASSNCGCSFVHQGLFCTSGGTSPVVLGGVPTRTLGLPDSYAFDEWGNRLTYVMTVPTDPASATSTLSVSDLSGNSIPGIEALVISYGHDGIGAFPRHPYSVATATPPCVLAGGGASATQSELQNCSNYSNAVTGGPKFVIDKFNSSTTNFYDDVVKPIHRCPGNVDGCSMWYDASDAKAVLKDGSNVTKLSNKASLNINMIAPSSSYEPAYNITQLNGLATMNLNGTTYLKSSTGDVGIDGNISRTVFYLTKFDPAPNPSTNAFPALFSFGATNSIYAGDHQRFGFGTGYDSNNPRWTYMNNGSLPANINPVANGSWHLHSMNYSNSYLSWTMDGTIILTNGEIQATPAATFYLGQTSGISSAAQDFAEMVVYPSSLTFQQQRKVECYIEKKWGLQQFGCTCPASVLGCALWLDASDIGDVYHNTGATQPANGSTITDWKDKSGNSLVGARDMSVSDKSSFPTLVTSESTANNMPVLNFSSTQSIHSGNIGLPYGTWTIIYAGRLTGGSNQRIMQGTTGNWLLGAWMGYSEAAYWEGWLGYQTGADTNWRIYTGAANSTSGTGNFYSNGTLIASSGNLNPPSGGGLAFNDGGCCGGESSNMEIAEVAAYPISLSTRERKRVECYLANKYGQCSSLTGGGAAYCSGIGAPVAYCGANPQ